MTTIQIWIEPHERAEAMDAYKDWFSPEQRDDFESAPDSALIILRRIDGTTSLIVVEEG